MIDLRDYSEINKKKLFILKIALEIIYYDLVRYVMSNITIICQEKKVGQNIFYFNISLG